MYYYYLLLLLLFLSLYESVFEQRGFIYLHLFFPALSQYDLQIKIVHNWVV